VEAEVKQSAARRRIAIRLGVLAILLISQAAGITVNDGDLPRFQYSGSDLVGVVPLDVRGDPTNDRITVSCPRFEVALPFAKDWVFILPPNSLMVAESESRDLVASITVHPVGKAIQPSTYLIAQEATEREHFAISGARIVTTRPMPYLIHKSSQDSRTDIWWAIQSVKLDVFRLHISTSARTPDEEVALMARLCPLVESGFKVRK
jgi:hypothetical protein